jgi:hypothetical protein|tara:strand:- start:6126 stop:6227 length:102 start_codon:yes stop_codon:yes gene_type:complete
MVKEEYRNLPLDVAVDMMNRGFILEEIEEDENA